MADSILTVLQQFLCYGNQACIQEFNQYAYKPAEGIFYAVFFPIVVILLFVYIVSGAIGSLKAKGFRILIGVAFFAFIILQGWYYFFIQISKMWFIVLFLLGILWFVIHTFTGREGGGAKAREFSGVSKSESVFGQAIRALKNKGLGVEGAQLGRIEADIATLRTSPKGSHGMEAVADRVGGALIEMRADLPRYAMNKAQYDKLYNEYIKVAKSHGVKALE